MRMVSLYSRISPTNGLLRPGFQCIWVDQTWDTLKQKCFLTRNDQNLCVFLGLNLDPNPNPSSSMGLPDRVPPKPMVSPCKLVCPSPNGPENQMKN